MIAGYRYPEINTSPGNDSWKSFNRRVLLLRNCYEKNVFCEYLRENIKYFQDGTRVPTYLRWYHGTVYITYYQFMKKNRLWKSHASVPLRPLSNMTPSNPYSLFVDSLQTFQERGTIISLYQFDKGCTVPLHIHSIFFPPSSRITLNLNSSQICKVGRTVIPWKRVHCFFRCTSGTYLHLD